MQEGTVKPNSLGTVAVAAGDADAAATGPQVQVRFRRHMWENESRKKKHERGVFRGKGAKIKKKAPKLFKAAN